MFLPHFIPHTEVAAISCLFSCGTSVYNALRHRKDIAYKTTFPMLLSAMVTIPIAVYFSTHISGHFFEMFLGIVLIILSLYFFFFSKTVKIRPTAPNGILAGSLGGILGGLFFHRRSPGGDLLNPCNAG